MAIKIGDDHFKDRVATGLQDSFMRQAVSSAQERLHNRRLDAVEELGEWEEWRSHGEEIRQHVLDNLDYYLNQLSENVVARGGHLFFAETAEEANEYIKTVVHKHQAKKIVKSKSMVTEEISLNKALEEVGCEVIETDLGEYILQVDDNDPPSHIVAPALHKNKEQIRDVFKEKLNYTKTEKPEELTTHVRYILREAFLTADIGITGCNFAIADSGSVGLVTNEGNGRMVTTLPKVQISVMGMERIVPTHKEFEVLVSMLTRSAVGQKLPSYVTALTGPRASDEVYGPEEFHLVIIDNGRSNILGTDFQSVLQCIRCAACVNVCPVYRHVGGHSYGSIYSGPIGAVLTPLLGGYDDYKELPYASTLCAACTDACPVKIPLHELLHKHRQVIVERDGRAPFAEKMAMKAFGMGEGSPTLYKLGSKLAPMAMSRYTSEGTIKTGPAALKAWTAKRDLPAPSKTSFRDWFASHNEGGK